MTRNTAAIGTRWMDRPETWLGMTVAVILIADRSEHVGRIVAVDGNGTPTIELEDGRRIGGLDCWWTKREEQGE